MSSPKREVNPKDINRSKNVTSLNGTRSTDRRQVLMENIRKHQQKMERINSFSKRMKDLYKYGETGRPSKKDPFVIKRFKEVFKADSTKGERLGRQLTAINGVTPQTQRAPSDSSSMGSLNGSVKAYIPSLYGIPQIILKDKKCSYHPDLNPNLTWPKFSRYYCRDHRSTAMPAVKSENLKSSAENKTLMLKKNNAPILNSKETEKAYSYYIEYKRQCLENNKDLDISILGCESSEYWQKDEPSKSQHLSKILIDHYKKIRQIAFEPEKSAESKFDINESLAKEAQDFKVWITNLKW